MRIMLLNHFGGGFADHLDVPDGMTITRLFAEQIPDGRATDYLIRCNRLPVSADHILQEGDRVTITPLKIEGAR